MFKEQAPQPYSFKTAEEQAQDLEQNPQKHLSSAQIAESVKTSTDPFVAQQLRTDPFSTFFDRESLKSLKLPEVKNVEEA